MTRRMTFSTDNQEFDYSLQLSTDVFDVTEGVLKISFNWLDLLFKRRREEARLLGKLKQGAHFYDRDNNCSYLITRINKETLGNKVVLTIVFVDENMTIRNNHTYHISNFGTMSLNVDSVLYQADQIVSEMSPEDKELANELLAYLKSHSHLEKGGLSKFKNLLLNNTDFGTLIFEIIKAFLTK